MSKKLVGTVKYIDLGTGFWGIIDKSGKEWLPINMPEQLKHEGKEVTCRVIPYDGFTTHMWGEAVKVVSFQTIH